MKPLAVLLVLITSLRSEGQDSLHLPYRTEKVYFYNADKSIRYAGTLTMPVNAHKVKGVVLVSGTGKQDRDFTVGPHKIFAVIADSLTRRGVAVLRVDDRGTGETGGVYENCTTEDFANDALLALHYLQTQPGINNKATGLVGHSEGGAAILIAAAQSKDVAFIITLAGLATRGIDAVIKQNKDIVAAADITDYTKKRYDTINRLLFETVYEFAGKPELEERLRTRFDAWKIADDSAFAKDFPGKLDHFRFFLESYIKQATSKWYQYYIRFDPMPYLSRITVPILAMNGDKDLMVSYRENLASIEQWAKAAGNKNVTIKVFPGLNHLFQPCTTCDPREYTTLAKGFSPEAITVMTTWLTHLTIQ